MCAQARRLLSEFAIDTDGCAEHDGERQPADDLGQRYPGAEQVEEEIFQHPAEPWRPIATPEQSTPGSSDGSWTCIAATLARKQFGAAGGAELPQAPSASLISSPTAATASTPAAHRPANHSRRRGRLLKDDSSRSEEHTSELQSLMRNSYA